MKPYETRHLSFHATRLSGRTQQELPSSFPPRAAEDVHEVLRRCEASPSRYSAQGHLSFPRVGPGVGPGGARPGRAAPFAARGWGISAIGHQLDVQGCLMFHRVKKNRGSLMFSGFQVLAIVGLGMSSIGKPKEWCLLEGGAPQLHLPATGHVHHSKTM